jgi:hypothetical protein
MRRVARTTAASVLCLAVLLAATGWLYTLRPVGRLAGPGVHDALALDELSRRATVPLAL